MIGSHVQEMSRTGTSIERSRGTAARSWGEWGDSDLVGMGFILGMMKMYWG